VAATVVPLLPGNAGSAMMQLAPSGLLSPETSFAVFTGFVIATTAAAVLVLRRCDA